ncbi:MAG: hypothetical protein A3J75_05065 [Acidobacteria bacterium RBG_16_68_9]|nr:MAG: hypothetical protein A3J75_05065 [Acidobacteria bacterium RBG_16_68_9]
MTLREWSEKYGIDMRGAFWVPDTFTREATRAELWSLTDYTVSSVVGGVVWLVKRPAEWAEW